MDSWKDGVLAERIDAVIRLFLYILIFWLPYSPAVIESCVIICLILWIVKRSYILKVHGARSPATFKKRLSDFLIGFNPKSSSINTPIIFFLAVCLLSVVGSAFFEQSWHNFLTKTLEWFIVYFLTLEVITKYKYIRIILLVLLSTTAATAVDSIIQFYLTHKDFFLGHSIAAGSQATAGFKTPNGLGAYLALMVPIVLSLSFVKWENKKYRFVALLTLVLILWSLMTTFSRGAWFGTSLGIAFFLAIFLFHKQRSEFYFVFGLSVMMIVLAGWLWLAVTRSWDMEFATRYQTAQWRWNIWQDCIKMIKDRPFLGHGINTFMRLFETYRRDVGTNPTYAHNCYLQLAAETGIVGLLSFLWIIVGVFRESLRRINTSAMSGDPRVILSMGLLSGIFAFLIHSFFDTHFYSLQLSVCFWFMVAVLMVLNHLEEERYV